MKSMMVTSVLLFATTFTVAAHAQGQVVTETPDVQLEVVLPQPNPTWQEFRLEELQSSSRRSRNALIGLAATSVVGLAFLIPSDRFCQELTNANGQQEYRCSRTGKALTGIGLPLTLGGLTGTLISGIMLGVRKGKARRLERNIALQRARAVRWDPGQGSFVF